MIITEARVSTAQTSFGIVGLTRSELDEVQCFIEGLRKVNSDSEPMSERGPLEPSRDRSRPNGMLWKPIANDGMALQPDHALARRINVQQPPGESNSRPVGSCNMKSSVLRKSLRRRAKHGKLLVIGSLFVLPPNTSSPYTPTKVDAEPDTPNRQ